MRIVLKTSVALVITAITPIVVFFLMGCLLGVLAIFVSVISGKFQVKLDDLLNNIIWFPLWPLICIILVGPISFGHVFFIGLPTLLVSWHFRVIRRWSTLIISIMIGAIPSTIYIFFFQNIGWEESSYFYQNPGILSFAFTVSTAIIMGFFGLSGGFVFWLLWRHWVSPNSPEGRPLLGLQDVEIKPLGANE